MKVKICGLETVEAAQTAASAGADFLGFIFWPRSRRAIEPEAAAAICQTVKGAARIGVFVDERPAEIQRIARLCRLDYVQLHGHEDAAFAASLQLPVIKAFRWGDDFSPEAANAFPAEIILLDSFARGMPGGTGQTFAWQQAAAAAKQVKKPLLVAGGINQENVGLAQQIFQPFGVDVSGSLEENGEKSLEKIRVFMRVIRRGNEYERHTGRNSTR